MRSAEEGNAILLDERIFRDDYGNIIKNILDLFVQHQALTQQLANNKYQLKVSELQLLQSQINPHFLFNTLQNINWKIYALSGGKRSYASDMIEGLSSILRYALDVETTIVPLDKEIDNAKSYVAIQKNRYGDKMDVVWDIRFREGSAPIIPKLILQPLIENSIYHGVKPLETTGLIKVYVLYQEPNLTLKVIDNGLGIPLDRLAAIRHELKDDTKKAEHIGLSNTYKRLSLTFGEGLSFNIRSKINWGTSVSIKINYGNHSK